MESVPTTFMQRLTDFGLLLKLGEDGTITKRVDFPNNRFMDIAPINENRVVVSGVENQNAWIAVVDSNLNIIWEWTKPIYNVNASQEIFERLRVKEQFIFSVGKSFQSGSDTMFVYKFDLTGNLLLTKTATSASPSGDLRGFTIFEDGQNEDDFWISAQELATTQFSTLEALKVDENLNFMDTIAFSPNKQLHNVRFFSEKNLIYGGDQSNAPDSVPMPLLNPERWWDLSFGKKTIDSTFVVFPLDPGHEYYGKMDSTDIHAEKRNLDYTQNDLIYLGGISKTIGSLNRSPFEAINSWFFINCLDSTGVLQWQRYIGGDENYYLMSILATRDGGVLLLGTTFDYNSGVNRRNVHIVKLKNDIQVNSENIKIENDFSVQVFPNPATDYIQFSIVTKQAKSQNYQLKIYNLSGQLMMEKQLRTGLSTYSVSSLAKGQYFYMITDENNRLMKSDKFVKVK